MGNRARLVIFGLLIVAALGVLAILSTIISQNNMEATRQATIKAIYLTNTAVAVEIHPCDVIASTLKMSHVCDNWYDGWTWTPSPTDPSLSVIQVSGTAIRATHQTLGTVLAACATLKNSQQDNIYPCPYFWITATAMARQTTTPVHTPTLPAP
jgi:hypothetical protein